MNDQKFNNSYPEDDTSILVTLTDSTVIESRSYQHFFLSEPADFIFGRGKIKKYVNSVPDNFEGRIDKSVIDSTKQKVLYKNKVLRYYLSKGEMLTFEDGNYFEFNKNSEKGFYISGTLQTEGNMIGRFYGKLDREKIAKFEVEKFDFIKSGLLTIGILGVIIGIGLIAMSNLSWGWGSGLGGGRWF
jgi:hypothetical protein